MENIVQSECKTTFLSHVFSWKAAKTNSMPLGTTRDLGTNLADISSGTNGRSLLSKTKFTKWRLESVARGQAIRAISLSNSNTLSPIWDLKRAQPIIPVVPAVMQGYTGYTVSSWRCTGILTATVLEFQSYIRCCIGRKWEPFEQKKTAPHSGWTSEFQEFLLLGHIYCVWWLVQGKPTNVYLCYWRSLSVASQILRLALPVWGVRFVKYLASLWASIHKLIDIKPLHSVKMVKTWHVTTNSRTSYLNEGLPQGEVNNEGWPHILWRDILSDH